MKDLQKGSYYSAEIIDCGDKTNFEFIYLGHQVNVHWVLLYEENFIDQEKVQSILNLTTDQLRKGDAYDIDPDLDEDVVYYDEIDGKLFTCLGMEVLNITNINL